FPPGQEQKHANYLVPEAMNSLAYQVEHGPGVATSVMFSAAVHLVNYQDRPIDLQVTRQVEVLDWCPFTLGLDNEVEFVGFQSRTYVKNAGVRALTWQTGTHPVHRPANSPLPTAWLRVAPGQELHLVEVAGYTPSPFEGEFGRHVAVSHPAAGFTD